MIGTDITFAPFEFQDVNGDFVGIDMDLLEAIAEDQGFNYEIKPLGFNAAVQALEVKTSGCCYCRDEYNRRTSEKI